MGSIPLQRSKALLQDDGWKVWITEKWNQWTGHREDLFGFADLIAIRADVEGCLAIQCCSGNASAHIKKYLEGWTDDKGKFHGPNEYLDIWKKAGNKLIIHSWTKRGERGKRKVWTLRTIDL